MDFDEDNEGWVSFQYERLPNLCYWCGHLTHDDKECALWLRSKGTLSVEEQQFGSWIRASQFNLAKKSVVEVQGYENMNGTSKQRGRTISVDRTDTVPVPVSVGNVEASNVSGESGKPVANQSAAEYAATLQEIDDAINAGFENQNLNKEDVAVTVEQNEKEIDMEVNEAEIRGRNNLDVQLTPRLGEQVIFTAGWVDKDRDNRRKGEACGIKTKIIPRDDGPKPMQAAEHKPIGTWTRMHAKPRNVNAPMVVDTDKPKSKKRNQTEGDGVTQENEKRSRMEEETKNLSMLMASKFESAEVAMQLRREQ